MNHDQEATRGFWRSRARSFVYAGRGLVELLRNHPNAWLHIGATIAVIAAGLLLRLTQGEWALLTLAMGAVWTAESLNSAIELLADRITTEADARIRRAKDLGAAAVLLASIAAAITGLLVLGPRLLALVQGM